jgi:hypothetical protein
LRLHGLVQPTLEQLERVGIRMRFVKLGTAVILA